MNVVSLFLFCLLILANPCHAAVRSKYFVAIKKHDKDLYALLDNLEEHKAMTAPYGKFYADPMLFKHEGINYLFYEDFDYKKGRIAYVTIDENLNLSEPKIVLETMHHCSFPHIFEDDGRIFMTPETAALNEVSIYEAIDFPDHWVKVKTVLRNGWYGDPTIFKYDGYYWLFTVKDSVADLEIYFSESLLGNYKPHPINKEKIQSRNAGHMFLHEGKMIRPVMNCEDYYGVSMTLKEIVTLTPTEFVEKPIQNIFPDWDPRLNGTHTLDVNEDFIVYDGRYHEPDPKNPD